MIEILIEVFVNLTSDLISIAWISTNVVLC